MQRALMLEAGRDAGTGDTLEQALRARAVTLDRTRSAAQLHAASESPEPCCCVVLDARALQARAAFDALRRDAPALPLLVLAAGCDAAERVEWLDRGAEDVLPPAPDTAELAARIAACLRRVAARGAPPELRIGALVLQPAHHLVSLKGRTVTLTRKEFALLELLVRGVREAHSRAAIHAALGGAEGGERASNLVEVHVHALRRKLGAALIRTVRGVGYRIDAAQAEG